MEKVTMGIMIGKAVKLAEGHGDTHSRNRVMNVGFISKLAVESGCLPELCDRIRQIKLARELWTLLPSGHPFFALLLQKCEKVCRGFLHDSSVICLLLIPENLPEDIK